jgi:hypothetical protein
VSPSIPDRGPAQTARQVRGQTTLAITAEHEVGATTGGDAANATESGGTVVMGRGAVGRGLVVGRGVVVLVVGRVATGAGRVVVVARVITVRVSRIGGGEAVVAAAVDGGPGAALTRTRGVLLVACATPFGAAPTSRSRPAATPSVRWIDRIRLKSAEYHQF